MEISIEHRPSYALAVCRLAEGEQVRAESGAMISMSSNVSIETQTGGVMKGLKRALLGRESLFQNLFTARGAPGEVTLAPTLPGDILHLTLNGELMIQGTSYIASSPSIELDTSFSGFKGFFSGEGAFMLKASGSGDLLINAFGAIHEVEVDGEYVVDTGHIVAFEPALDYKVGRVGGWVATFFSGEGLVCRYQGKGKLWLQSRNPGEYGSLVGGQLPPKE